MDLLRFTTAGSVDDGKSTLIGRLLYDSQGVYEDQLQAARRVTRAGTAGALDFALLTDGLRAEREQGITIDVAYRYFSTPRRKFIIADAPGHEQYTRNMATAASNADLAVILIDARRGVLPQSRRHAYIAWLLGIPRIIVAVNKMDQVAFSEDVFRQIRADFTAYAGRLEASQSIEFIPLSALEGDNVVERSARMPWYGGSSLLHRLETIPLSDRAGGGSAFRFPVQYVIRAGDFRGFAGRIAAGAVRPGDRVMALPSGRESRVRSISTWEGDLSFAEAPNSVTLCLEDEIDISRGDMLASPSQTPRRSSEVRATLVWMSVNPLRARRPYLLKHAAQTVRARVEGAIERVDVQTLETESANTLRLNEIGRAVIAADRVLAFDLYSESRATGAFILIDSITNETVAAGMIAGAAERSAVSGEVQAWEREARNGHRAAVVLAPSDEAAAALERDLFESGIFAAWVREPSPSALASLYRVGGVVILSRPAADLPGGAYTIDLSAAGERDSQTEIARLIGMLEPGV